MLYCKLQTPILKLTSPTFQSPWPQLPVTNPQPSDFQYHNLWIGSSAQHNRKHLQTPECKFAEISQFTAGLRDTAEVQAASSTSSGTVLENQAGFAHSFVNWRFSLVQDMCNKWQNYLEKIVIKHASGIYFVTNVYFPRCQVQEILDDGIWMKKYSDSC